MLIEDKSKGTAGSRKRGSWCLKHERIPIPMMADQERVFILLDRKINGNAGPMSCGKLAPICCQNGCSPCFARFSGLRL